MIALAEQQPRPVAALFVDVEGPYIDVPGIDPWTRERDARLYAGPHPVVAHPPCERWGRYWFGGPSVNVRKALGDDGGCFAAALSAVRRWGGVIEHPEASHAWRKFGIVTPPKGGGWIPGDLLGGWTCCVEQGHYGHTARKATWLYVWGVAGSALPELIWGPCREKKARIDDGFHSAEERRRKRPYSRSGPCERLSKRQRLLTPPAFADLMLSLARLVP